MNLEPPVWAAIIAALVSTINIGVTIYQGRKTRADKHFDRFFEARLDVTKKVFTFLEYAEYVCTDYERPYPGYDLGTLLPELKLLFSAEVAKTAHSVHWELCGVDSLLDHLCNVPETTQFGNFWNKEVNELVEPLRRQIHNELNEGPK